MPVLHPDSKIPIQNMNVVDVYGVKRKSSNQWGIQGQKCLSLDVKLDVIYITNKINKFIVLSTGEFMKYILNTVEKPQFTNAFMKKLDGFTSGMKSGGDTDESK